MNTRCKPDGLAIIAIDFPSCKSNIGRVVKVSGPPALNRYGQLTWLIQPVTPEPFGINDSKGEFDYFMKPGETGIEHPDDWMIPIPPNSGNEEGAYRNDRILEIG